MSSFDQIGTDALDKPIFPNFIPECTPPVCFIGAYPPPSPAGIMGPFLTNTYLLQPNRRSELQGGPIPITSKMLTESCT